MIDQRILQSRESLKHYQLEISNAKRLLAKIDKDEALLTTQKWFKALLDCKFGPIEDKPPSKLAKDYVESNFAQALRASESFFRDQLIDIEPLLKDGFVSFLTRSGSGGLESHAAMVLAGQAAGKVLAEYEPNIKTMDLIGYHLFHLIYFVDSFEDSFVDNLKHNQRGKKAWLRELCTLPIDASGYLRWTRDDNEIAELQQEIGDWLQGKDPFIVWNRYPVYRRPSLIVERRMRLIYKLDPESWLMTMDKLPAPSLIEEVIDSLTFTADPEFIHWFVGKSPVVFEDDKWVSERTILALYGPELTLDCAKQLFKAVQATTQNLETAIKTVRPEIRQWFENSFKLLMDRPDGPLINASYLGHLMGNYYSGRVQRNQTQNGAEWFPEMEAMEVLTEILEKDGRATNALEEVVDIRQKAAGHFHERRTQKGLIETGKRVPSIKRFPYFFSALFLENKETSRSLWEKFCDLTLFLDPELDWLTNPHFDGRKDFIMFHIGQLLTRIVDPVAEWQSAWNRLGFQRLRAQHKQSESSDNPLSASVFLIHVGNGALTSHFLTPGSGPIINADTAYKLWKAVFRATCSLWSPHFSSDHSYNWQSLLLNSMISSALYWKPKFGPGKDLAIKWARDEYWLVGKFAYILSRNGWEGEIGFKGDLFGPTALDLRSAVIHYFLTEGRKRPPLPPELAKGSFHEFMEGLRAKLGPS